MYGTEKDIRRNLFLFFVDGVLFEPGMTLISITAVIPFFLEQLGASTIQIAIAAALTYICCFVAQPFFGSIATRSRKLHRSFANVLILQRFIFLAFVLSIPLFINNSAMLVWMFLFFWGVFNFFVGSNNVFYTTLMLKLLPPNKRGMIRGLGHALGSVLGVGVASLIPVILNRITFPYNYEVIFSFGLVFLFANSIQFYFMHEHEDVEPRVPMGIVQYLKGIPESIREDKIFRAMILTCVFLVAANSLLAYYTLYAIRIFSATETHIAILAALAVISSAIGRFGFGVIIDRCGPKTTTIIAAGFVLSAGLLALVTNSLNLLFAAWVLANLGKCAYETSESLLIGEVSPSVKMPLYVGVQTTISLALSSTMLLLLAPALERVGFWLLFMTVFGCGIFSLLSNLFVLHKRMAKRIVA